GGPPPDDAAYRARLRRLDDDQAVLRRSNSGGETLSAARQRRIRAIARTRWSNGDGVDSTLLSTEEAALLCIPKGTLSAGERDIINYHVVATINMLEALPWPKHLRRVPEYAGGHHERMDGKGYPRGLTGAQLAAPARILAIADIFEALTAKDRPYKDGKTLSDALAILGRMKQDGHIDPDLFDVFIRDRVYLRYAERFLDAAQIDAVDPAAIPGYAADNAAPEK
ncbi:MAG TPA: phosphohydrolase, partial [Betaproteobacteria bacterium]|nr:phosphohydrolase [Betaproteobacteria bacterium]